MRVQSASRRSPDRDEVPHDQYDQDRGRGLLRREQGRDDGDRDDGQAPKAVLGGTDEHRWHCHEGGRADGTTDQLEHGSSIRVFAMSGHEG